VNRPGERPAELADVQGAWRRGGRTILDGPWKEVTDVLWLQAGRHFCDLRAPQPGTTPAHVLDQAQAFSGTVIVGAAAISFHHDLDSLERDPAHPDEGTVHRKDDAMFERGPGFEERWIVASRPGDDVGIAELHLAGDDPPLARLIRIGPVALAVWGGAQPGGAQFDGLRGWVRERNVHECDQAMGIDAAALALGTGEPLPRGWSTAETEGTKEV
jgi:hypothetical protein